MKHLFFYISLAIFLTACSEKTNESSASDSISIAAPTSDTTIHSPNNISADNYYGVNDSYFEALNQEGSQTIVTFDTEMYADSLLQQPVGVSISAGEDVTIEKHTNNVVNGNWNEPVYKIAYTQGYRKIYGYISQSKIACLQDTLKSNKLVLLTLNYNHESDKFIGNVFLMDQTRKILSTSQIDFNIYKKNEPPYSFYYYFSIGEIEENTGLEGITESFYISAGYDACGYPHITNIFFWNGQHLILAPETYSVSDSGVFYANSELHFPTDSLGRAGYIVKICEVVQQVEGPSNSRNTEYIDKDSTVVLYKWNKMNYTFGKADTIIKKSRSYSVATTDY